MAAEMITGTQRFEMPAMDRMLRTPNLVATGANFGAGHNGLEALPPQILGSLLSAARQATGMDDRKKSAGRMDRRSVKGSADSAVEKNRRMITNAADENEPSRNRLDAERSGPPSLKWTMEDMEDMFLTLYDREQMKLNAAVKPILEGEMGPMGVINYLRATGDFHLLYTAMTTILKKYSDTMRDATKSL